MSFAIPALRSAVRQFVRATPAFVRPSPFQFRTLVSTRFTTDHEWISYDDATSVGTIGITDYAQKALGDVVFVELPSVGTQIAAAEQIGAVESVKAASDIFAPVSGTVTEVNESLEDQPGLLNKSAEQDGWLAKMELTNPAEFEALLTADAYKAHCEGGDGH